MPHRVVKNTAGIAVVDQALSALRTAYNLDATFPAEAEAEAVEAAQRFAAPEFRSEFVDRTEIPFVTIDPASSRDLDQALHLEREGAGYLVRYAISAVGRLVPPGGALDAETLRRGQTIYGPDGSIPLHPEVLSTGVASLLPGQVGPAYLWYHHLDASGELTHTWVELALVRSVAKLSYVEVQAAADGAGSLPAQVPGEFLALFREVGTKRVECEVRRGGVSLNLPDQEVDEGPDGFVLAFRSITDVEAWNAQISLLTGMAAAGLMLKANRGVLRTMPPARQSSVDSLRAVAKALGLTWPGAMSYGDFLRTVTADTPQGAAFLTEATSLFRGAGYTVLPVADDAGRHGQALTLEHAAVGAPYAHVTAPLRRLVDRFGLEVCLCVCAGRDIPQWVEDGLAQIEQIMAASGKLANGFERDAINIVEAVVMSGRTGERFEGVVVDLDIPRRRRGANDSSDGESRRPRGIVQLAEPAVQATVVGDSLERGERVVVTVESVDIPSGELTLAVAN